MQQTTMNKVPDLDYQNKALLSVNEMCNYLSIGQIKCRELLADPANGFTVRIGSRLYAHKKHWISGLRIRFIRNSLMFFYRF